jgi:hypothetical protein
MQPRKFDRFQECAHLDACADHVVKERFWWKHPQPPFGSGADWAVLCESCHTRAALGSGVEMSPEVKMLAGDIVSEPERTN